MAIPRVKIRMEERNAYSYSRGEGVYWLDGDVIGCIYKSSEMGKVYIIIGCDDGTVRECTIDQVTYINTEE